jgi:transketolase
LSRQNLPIVRKEHVAENRSALGAYVLREAPGARDVTLFATGSEVSLALAAADELAKQNVKAAVVSIPCFELFAEQAPGYRASVLGQAPRVGIEAALRQGWDAVLAPGDFFIGMTDFGASAPIADLYKFFGITVEAIVNAARAAAGHGTVS